MSSPEILSIIINIFVVAEYVITSTSFGAFCINSLNPLLVAAMQLQR